MHQSKPLTVSPAEIIRLLRAYRWRWLAPVAAAALLAGFYACVRPDSWEASQTLIVRNEAAGNLEDPGRFRHSDDRKTAQETMLEIVKSRGVLSQALAQLGPPAGTKCDAWPSPADVERFADAVKLVPPQGTEFGKTEVLYLRVKDHDRRRALALVTAVCDQLLAQVQHLRDAKAGSMINELTTAVALAQTDLQAATRQLTSLETQVGSDLAELRVLHGSSSGDSDLRRRIQELETELRQARLDQRNQQDLHKLLTAALDDPGRLLAAPNRLLESQPALRRLKEGLVDAQLRTAQLLGGRTESHPLVRAAREAEQQVSVQLHDELAVALRGVEVDLRLVTGRASMLAEQLSDGRSRLERLAGLRAEYSNLVAEVQHRTTLLEQAQRQLAETRGSQAGARAASLLSRIDAPATGAHPAGPRRAVIVLVGLVGGLLIGGGVLFLTVPGLPAPVAPAAATAQPPSLDEPPRPAFVEPCHSDCDGGLPLRQSLKDIFGPAKGQTRNGHGAL